MGRTSKLPRCTAAHDHDGVQRRSFGRPQTRTIYSDNTYVFDYAYNALGQLDTLTYPTSPGGVRFKAKYGYASGYLTSVQNFTGDVPGTVLWNLNLLDARMNATSETYGNGLWLQNSFDPLAGVPLTRQSGTGGQASNVQNLRYTWDTAGNLTQRQDLRQALAETFTYDALDRLTLASGPATQSTALSYDAIGNLLTKSGVSGTYTYHATKKHAVVAAGGTAYAYDANGNLSSRGGATVTWSSANYPISIGDPSGYSAQFAYAPDRSRWRQVSTYAGATETTIYVGGLLEKLTTATRTHWKHLIATPSGQVQVIRRDDGTSETLYVTTDHLGSTDAVLNANGAVLLQASFGVLGARRGANWQGVPSATEWQSIANTTRLGYTGHEQLDNVMLVHMNGRVFDPKIGRFLSADPYIDGADTTQGWNRYAYVRGRAMSATDPSGFALEEIITEAQRIARQNARAANFNIVIAGGSASVEGRETSSFIGDSGLEEVLVQGARIRPGGGNSLQVIPQSQTPQQCFSGAEPGSGGETISDVIVGFGDAFLIPILVRNLLDISGDIDYDSPAPAYMGGMITGTLWGSATIALRGGAAVGGTKFGHALNHNPTVRLGPGRMPAAGGLPSGTAVPRISFGSRPGGLHGDLRSRVPHLPPVGALAGGGDGC